MKYRKLGRTGIKVSVIGFGGIPIQRVSGEDACIIVDKALNLGINFFDTARGYTDSEAKLGAALKKRRKEAVIATKSLSRTKEGMAADIQKSLETLRTDFIDIYQMHNVKDEITLEQVLSENGALAALIEAKNDGLIGHIGITGHIKSHLLEAIKTEEIETVQFPFNAVETTGVKVLLNETERTGAGVIIMKPLAGGVLKNAGLALRYILGYPVSTVIPGMDFLEQVEENASAGNNPYSLSADEMRILEEEAAKLGAVFCRRCEYCLPCHQGIDIPSIFLLDGYFTRYDLPGWAKERYRGLPVKADSCLECGECEEKCPYSLPIRKMLKNAAARMA
ncbi:MAG: L-glyceraldehyde 3-phosphate reductase [Pelotomaculum sp. PtaB.Bin013]|uniref:Aldo/keto reductase n=1 Tax=Pelotomaculum isophthalicicum JI TaxID=947010 RepID=A0A9X4JVW9_9FIRM|nr:aldo/keto reductase [Pelotomaculum isophthalicicum]MDF9409101.1 aldo/keto reductase [Pelotomaculum isophthalicicum JI]OPX82978.1 MAG: L-glyceraldehyde 3-phosphate reductase [Pelotomaculum sp. PtaB.Bin013]